MAWLFSAERFLQKLILHAQLGEHLRHGLHEAREAVHRRDAGHLAQAFEAAHSAFHIDELVARIHALDGKTPAELYRNSARRSLSPLLPTYPQGWLTRRVSKSGYVRIYGKYLNDYGAPAVGGKQAGGDPGGVERVHQFDRGHVEADVQVAGDGLVVGEDPIEDARRFRRTDSGITLITQAMLNRLAQTG